MSIDLVTIVISRERITVQAVGDAGIIKEEYRRTRRATIKRVDGDFDRDEQILPHAADLLHDLVALGSTVREIQEDINMQ